MGEESFTSPNPPLHCPLFHIRRVRPDDIARVCAIEREQFSHPKGEKTFREELANDLARFYAAETAGDGEMAGFILFWIIGETAELHDIAVGDRFKRKGAAAAMMDFMLAAARKENIGEVFLEVRVSNAPAAALYEKYGFQRAGERKNYYTEPMEDALVYRLELTPR